MFHDCGASSLKRTIANCTGFQTAFFAGGAACGSAEKRTSAETMAVCIPGIKLHHNFTERFVEQADGFVDVGFGGVEHGGEAEDIAHEAAFADEEAIVAGALHDLGG